MRITKYRKKMESRKIMKGKREIEIHWLSYLLWSLFVFLLWQAFCCLWCSACQDLGQGVKCWGVLVLIDIKVRFINLFFMSLFFQLILFRLFFLCFSSVFLCVSCWLIRRWVLSELSFFFSLTFLFQSLFILFYFSGFFFLFSCCFVLWFAYFFTFLLFIEDDDDWCFLHRLFVCLRPLLSPSSSAMFNISVVCLLPFALLIFLLCFFMLFDLSWFVTVCLSSPLWIMCLIIYCEGFIILFASGHFIAFFLYSYP